MKKHIVMCVACALHKSVKKTLVTNHLSKIFKGGHEMKKMLLRFLIVCAMFAGSAGVAFGTPMTPVFFDDFNSENGGVSSLNYNSFANWTVVPGSGAVDLIGNGNFDFYPGNGLYIDMDGSTGNAGILQSKAISVITGNKYLFKFDLAGNARGGADDFIVVDIHISDYSEIFIVKAIDAWQTIVREVTIFGNSPTAYIRFNHAGGDNVGAIIDNVSLTAAPVPEPGTLLLLGSGLAGVAWFARRRKNQ